MAYAPVTVAGAGILGLWQAFVLARRGHRVTLVDAAPVPFANTASRWAGAMLAPDCEAEAAPDLVRDYGHEGMRLWREVYAQTVDNGTLVLSLPRDRPELDRFARMTERHERLNAVGISKVEPELGWRFTDGLYFADESHMDPLAAMQWLLDAARAAGATARFGEAWSGQAPEGKAWIIDCRGMAAQNALPGLRGVRGERILVRAPEVHLARPVRLLHPRQPIYIVPQGDGRFVIGATVIEREDDGPASVRSTLDLLGNAYAVHASFAEAAILDIGAGVRPAYADNVPRVSVDADKRIVRVNGAYRHGFLLSPVLASAVAGYLASGEAHPLLAAAQA